MAWTRAGLVLLIAAAVAVAVVSGGSSADPRTPPALPELPPPFLGTAVVGSGGLTAAIDSYGDVVDLRAPGPAGRALIDNPAARQAAGTVAAETGIVPRVRIGGGPALPLWRADRVSQRYLPGTNVLVTTARFGTLVVSITYAARSGQIACFTHSGRHAGPLAAAAPKASISFASGDRRAASLLRCDDRLAHGVVRDAARSDRRWLARARPLGSGAPAWAQAMYRRSLLVLRALTDGRTGAVAAGVRDGWAYVWPRDASAAALAFAAAGYRPEARRVARFLFGLELGAAARFQGDGTPVAGRAAQGDAAGWVSAAARATGLAAASRNLGQRPAARGSWRDRADYQEGAPGDYLGNAIAAAGPLGDFASPIGLTRRAHGGGLDSVAAWAVRPYPHPALFPAVRRTLLRFAGTASRFGIVPSEDWPGSDPWSAPTAWTAWSLAALGERRAALQLLAALRRTATPTGDLAERVDAHSGIPRSTTPLAWSHAFAILALRELWPSPGRASA